jgi:alpha-beta hydrolase superfamily lysophospholipase
MRSDTFQFKAEDEKQLFVYRFLPDEGAPIKAVVHVAHGMAEHAGRYDRLARGLTAAGYAVYANDHRGHGKTAANGGDLGSFGAPGGFRRCVQDLIQLVVHEKAQHPSLPVFLFGHSMGSYMAQAYLIEAGASLKGAILAGSSGKPHALAQAGRLVARAERARLGPMGRSKLLNKLSFGAFNATFKGTRTAFDWLSRDAAEVEKYVNDPRCGFVVTTQLWVDVLDAISEISDPARQARVPRGLPVHVIAGSEDPVSDRTKSLVQLLGAYERAGLTAVTHQFYPGARHELLNETNRKEVTQDLVAWLDAHLA